jgi:hypothetical protein
VCTPLGVAHLFTVLSQLLVGPQFLRNLEEEYRAKFLEIQAMKSRLQQRIKNTKKMKQYLSPYANERRDNQLNGIWKKRNGQKPQPNNADKEDLSKMDVESLKKRWETLQAQKDSIDEVDAGDVLNRDPDFIQQYHTMMSIFPHGDSVIDESESVIIEKIRTMEHELYVIGT